MLIHIIDISQELTIILTTGINTIIKKWLLFMIVSALVRTKYVRYWRT